MEEENYKEVLFFKYCKLCRDADTKETDDPCNECLAHGALEGTEKPLYFVRRRIRE